MNESLKSIDIDIFLIKIMNKFMSGKKIFKLNDDNILLKDSEEIPRINADTCNQTIQLILTEMGYIKPLTREDLLTIIVMIENKLSFESIILYMGYFLDNTKSSKPTEDDNLNREIINKFYTNDYEFFFTTLNETFKVKYKNLKFRDDNYTIKLFHSIFTDLHKMLRVFIDIPLLPGTEVYIRTNEKEQEQESIDDDINYQNIYKIGTISSDFLLEHCNKFKNEIYWFDSPFKNGDLVIFKKEIEFGDEPNNIKIQIGEKARIFSYEHISKSNTYKRYGLYYKMNKKPWNYVKLRISEEELLNKELYHIETITESCHNANDEILKNIKKNEDLFNKLNSQTAGAHKKKLSRMKEHSINKQKSKKCPKHYYNEPDSENLNDDEEKDINKLRHGWNSKKYKDKYYYVNESMCRRKKQMRDQPLFDEFGKLIDRDNFNSKYLYRPRESFLGNDSFFVYNLSNHESSVLNLNMYDIDSDRIQSIKTNDKKLNKLWFYDYELYPIRIPSNPEYNKNEVYDEDDDDDYGSKYYPIMRSNFSFEKLKCDDNLVIFQNTKHISTEFIHTCIPILWLYKIFDNYYVIHDKDEKYEELKTNIFNKNLMKELLICLKRYIILENRFDNETLSFFIILGALQYITNNIRESQMKEKLKKTKYYNQKEQPKFSLFDRYYKLNYIIHNEMKSITKNYKNILVEQIPFIFKQIIPFWMNRKIEYEQKAIKDYSIDWTKLGFALLQLNQQVFPIIRHNRPDIFPSVEERKISNAEYIIDKLERKADALLRGPLSPFYNEFKDEFFPKDTKNNSKDDTIGFQLPEDYELRNNSSIANSSDLIYSNGKWQLRKSIIPSNMTLETLSDKDNQPVVSNQPSMVQKVPMLQTLAIDQKQIIDNLDSNFMHRLKSLCENPQKQCVIMVDMHGVLLSRNGTLIDGRTPIFFANPQIGAISRGPQSLTNFHLNMLDIRPALDASSTDMILLPDLILQPDSTLNPINYGISVIVFDRKTQSKQEFVVVPNDQLIPLKGDATKDGTWFSVQYMLNFTGHIAEMIQPAKPTPVVIYSCMGYNSKKDQEYIINELLKTNNVSTSNGLIIQKVIWRLGRHLTKTHEIVRSNLPDCDKTTCKIGDKVPLSIPLTHLDQLSLVIDLPRDVGTGEIKVHTTSYILYQEIIQKPEFSALSSTVKHLILLNLDSVVRTSRHRFPNRIAKDAKNNYGRSEPGDQPGCSKCAPGIRDRFKLKDSSLIQWEIGVPVQKSPTFSDPSTLPFKIDTEIAKSLQEYIKETHFYNQHGGSENLKTKLSSDRSLVDLKFFFDNYTQIFDVLDDKILFKSNIDIYITNVNKLRNQFYKIILLDGNIELFIIYTFRVIMELVYTEIIKAELEYSKTIGLIQSQIEQFNTINTLIKPLALTDWELYYTFINMNKEEFEKNYKLNKDITNNIIILAWSRYIMLNNISLDDIETNYESIISEIDTNDKTYKNKGEPIFVDDKGNQYTSDLIFIGKENTPNSKEPIVKEQEITIDLQKQTLDETKYIKIPIQHRKIVDSDESQSVKHDEVKVSEDAIEYSIEYFTDSLCYKIYNYKMLKTKNGLGYLRFIKENLIQLYNNNDILIELYEHKNNDLKILYNNIQKLYGLTIFTRDLFYTISEHIEKSRYSKFESIIKSINDVRMNIYSKLSIPREIYSNFSEALRYPFEDFDGELNAIISQTDLGKNITTCFQSIQDLIVKIGYQKINKTLFNDIKELPDIDTIKSKTKLEKEESDSISEKEESKCCIQ
jgi:hypothetical protein